MRIFCALFVSFLGLVGTLSAVDLKAELVPGQGFWKNEFQLEGNQEWEYSGFEWLDEGKRMRAGRGNTFGELKVTEVLVAFKSGYPVKVVMNFYNRGDDGALRTADFEALYAKVQRAVSVWVKQKPKAQKPRLMKHVTLSEDQWRVGPMELSLSQGVSRAHRMNGVERAGGGDFIKLEIALRGVKTASVAGANPKKAVQKKRDGTVFIAGVPMVDQGQKGYCAVAALERILKYYGMETDQHVLAQLAGTTADSGTSLEAMSETLRRAGYKMGFKLRFLIDFEMKNIEKLTERYDRYARRKKVQEVGDLDQYMVLDTLFERMTDHPDVLREAVRTLPDFKKFKKNVMSEVNAGRPLLWALLLGIVPEEGITPQTIGGHMRVIIGYNFKKPGEEVLIFSDSWGSGHEYKSIRLDDAFVATMSLALVTP